MEEPIESGKRTAARYEWGTSVFRCKPIPPETPRALGMHMGLPHQIDPPETDTPPAPPGDSDGRGPV